MGKKRGLIGVVSVGMLAAMLAAGSTAHADPPVAQATVVSAVPQLNTPDVQNGVVYAIGQVGNKMFLGGTFTAIGEHGSVNVVTRNFIAAFDATTGKIDAGFHPTVNGEVDAVIPGPGNNVYLAGKFTTVNGASTRVDLLDATTGLRVAGWTPPVLNGIVQTLTTVGGNLYIGGAFTSAKTGSQTTTHKGLVAVDGTTGAVVKTMTVQLTGRHGTGSRIGPLGPKRLALSPDGTQMVVIGNFTAAADSTTATPLHNDQVVRLNLAGSGSTASATVMSSWSTARYSAQCANGAFDSYVRDVQFSPDGSYFVIVATGGGTFDTNVDGTRALCDSAARWETSDTGSDVAPTWKDYTGNDTFWSVAVTGTAIYAGGHQRWVNNTNGSDNAAEGSVPRPGIVALDPINGLPLAWNAGRNPRGAGAYVVLATTTGIWVGSDTDWIGNHRYKHMKVAFFPLTNGYTLQPRALGTLPGNVYEAGPLANQHPEVLYRIDAGGPTVAANDGGPDWLGDQSDPSPYRNSGSSTAGWSPLPNRGANLPASTPSAIFDSERWDPGSNGDGGELRWDFPVPSGTTVTVRLYFANRYSGTSQPGQRVFDVSLEGNTVLPSYDIVADVGDQTGTMKEFTGVVSDGDINIDLTHRVENPLINGIEIIQTNPAPPPPPSGDSLISRSLDGSGNVGSTTTVDTNTMDWTLIRGAFMVDSWLYYGKPDSTFWKRSFDGTTLGAEIQIDPYNDPIWSNISNGSGGTYRGVVSDFYGQLPNTSSVFYVNGRIYYTLVGQSQMFSRYFSPDAGGSDAASKYGDVIGSDQFTVNDGGLDWSNIAGAFVTGSTLYYVTKSDGVLHQIAWATDHATGGSSVVDSTNNWASHGLFLH